jgi:hypothetical protein
MPGLRLFEVQLKLRETERRSPASPKGPAETAVLRPPNVPFLNFKNS